MTTSRICIGLFLAPLFLSFASAQDTPVTVFTSYELPSDSMREGAISTAQHKLVAAILLEANISYELVSAPFARSYLLAQNTPNSLIYAVTRTPEREEKLRWIGPVAPGSGGYYLYKLASRTDLMVTDLNSVRTHRIGVLRDDKFRQFFETQGFENLDAVNINSQNFRKLLAGRIDFFAESNGVIAGRCERREFDCSLLIPALKLEGVSEGVYLATNKDSDPEFIQALVDAHQTKVEDRTFASLIAEVDIGPR